MEDAYRAISRPPSGMEPGQRRDYEENKQREVFGWTFEEKQREMYPRYEPVVKDLMDTKEFRDYKDYVESL